MTLDLGREDLTPLGDFLLLGLINFASPRLLGEACHRDVLIDYMETKSLEEEPIFINYSILQEPI